MSLRIGIVGAGGIVRQRHWPGLRALNDVTITAVANSSPGSARKFLASTGIIADAMPDWQDLVSRSDIDIVWIGTHPNLHEPVTLAALAANKHVFCQARMACDLAGALRMLEAAERHPHLVTMLCPPPHGLEADVYIRQLLEKEVVGAITHIHLRSLSNAFLDPAAPAHWRQRREINGKNVMTLGIFVEVLQRWFGSISSVQTTGGIATPVRDGYEVLTPDFLDVRARFAAGFDARLEFSAVDPGPATDTLAITGSSGTLTIDFLSNTITLEKGGESSDLSPPPSFIHPWQVELDYIKAVRNPALRRPSPTFREGVAYMRVVDAVDTAYRKGTEEILEVPN